MTQEGNSHSNKIEVISSIEAIERIRPLWEKMQCDPNVDIDFYLTIIKVRAEILRPHILLLTSNGVPMAMLIGRIEAGRLDIRIGYKSIFRPRVKQIVINFGGLLGNLSQGNSAILISELMQSLKQGEADLIKFENVDVNSEFYTMAMTEPSALCRDYIKSFNMHWKGAVLSSVEELLAKWRKDDRRSLLRRIRNLEKKFHGKIKFVVYKKTDEVNKALQDAEEIAKKSYQRVLGVGFIDNNESLERYTLQANRGLFRAYLLFIDDKPCCFQIAEIYGDTFYFNSTAYDNEFKEFSPGIIMYYKIYEELCKEGAIKKLDFGFGDAYYKHRFCDHFVEVSHVYIFAFTFYGIFLNIVRTIIGKISLFMKFILMKYNLMTLIKRNWRNLLRDNKYQHMNQAK